MIEDKSSSTKTLSKREFMIQIAIELFVDQGFENTPTSQISSEANVATGTLFHHFKTKEELFNMAYLYAKDKSIVETHHKYLTEGHLKSRLKNAWNATQRWGYENKIYIDFMLNFRYSKYLTESSRTEAKELFRLFYDMWAEGKELGIFKDLSTEIIHDLYSNIYKSFLEHMSNFETYNTKLQDQGFKVLWDAIVD